MPDTDAEEPEVIIPDYLVASDYDLAVGYISIPDAPPTPIVFVTLKGLDRHQETVEQVYAFDPIQLASVGSDLASHSLRYARQIGKEINEVLAAAQPEEPVVRAVRSPSAYL